MPILRNRSSFFIFFSFFFFLILFNFVVFSFFCFCFVAIRLADVSESSLRYRHVINLRPLTSMMMMNTTGGSNLIQCLDRIVDQLFKSGRQHREPFTKQPNRRWMTTDDTAAVMAAAAAAAAAAAEGFSYFTCFDDRLIKQSQLKNNNRQK